MDYEFRALEKLCQWMPKWIMPDGLTLIGLGGSFLTGISLALASYDRRFLLMAILGLAIQWFGDSLDGRLAYYRNTPRKWYGWSLDLNADWISIGIIGLGFYVYFPYFKILAFIFVLVYGGSMLLSVMRYKISNTYLIDKMNVGPTEMRILACIVFLFEIILPGTLICFTLLASIGLVVSNVVESKVIMKEGDQRDLLEKMGWANA